MPSYGKAEHEKAFRIFYETRSWSKVSADLDLAYTTAFRWASRDFECPEGCPFHGWDDLIAERDRVLASKKELIESGNTDLDTHEEREAQAMQLSDEAKRSLVKGVVRTDLERLAHFEILYNKLFYEMTGIRLNPEQLAALITDDSFYDGGTKLKNLEGGVHSISALTKMIEEYKDRVFNDQRGVPATAVEKARAGAKKLTLKDLRELKQKLDGTSVSEFMALKEKMGEDEAEEKLKDPSIIAPTPTKRSLPPPVSLTADVPDYD